MNVQRMDTNRLPKQALQYKPKGRRNVGRPRKRWRDQLHLEDQGQETHLSLHEHDDDDNDVYLMKESEVAPAINGVSRRPWIPSTVVFWTWIIWCHKLWEINKCEDSFYGLWRRVAGRVVFDVSEDPTALIFVVKRRKKNILVKPLAPHYTAFTFQTFWLFFTTPVITTNLTILNSSSLALLADVRSRNVLNTDQRWRPVDCDYVRTDEDWCRLCMTPYSLEETLLLFFLPLSGYTLFNSCTSTTWAADFPEMLGRFYKTVRCRASTDGHLREKDQQDAHFS